VRFRLHGRAFLFLFFHFALPPGNTNPFITPLIHQFRKSAYRKIT
jgi:hypothetical protein